MNVYRIMVNITFRGFNRFRSYNVYNGNLNDQASYEISQVVNY